MKNIALWFSYGVSLAAMFALGIYIKGMLDQPLPVTPGAFLGRLFLSLLLLIASIFLFLLIKILLEGIPGRVGIGLRLWWMVITVRPQTSRATALLLLRTAFKIMFIFHIGRGDRAAAQKYWEMQVSQDLLNDQEREGAS